MADYFLTLSALSRSAFAIAIPSKLQIEQLFVFLGAKQLVLNNISYLISEESMLFDAVNLARAVVCAFLRMLCLCYCHLVLNEVPAESIHFFSLTLRFETQHHGGGGIQSQSKTEYNGVQWGCRLDLRIN